MDDKKSLAGRVWSFADFIFPYIAVSGWLIYRYLTVGLESYVRPSELIIISLVIARMATPRRK